MLQRRHPGAWKEGVRTPFYSGPRKEGFIALPETGWRQKSGASLGALLASPWGWWKSAGGRGFMGLSLHLKLL